MINRAIEISECISFLKLNSEFFQTLFTSPQSFAELIDSQPSPLIESMKTAFFHNYPKNVDNVPGWTNVAQFKRALFGCPYMEEKGLIHGNSFSIRNYLNINSQMLRALVDNKNDPIIDKWNSKNILRPFIITPTDSVKHPAQNLMQVQQTLQSASAPKPELNLEVIEVKKSKSCLYQCSMFALQTICIFTVSAATVVTVGVTMQMNK